jgi:hypothetical protein
MTFDPAPRLQDRLRILRYGYEVLMKAYAGCG